MHPRWYSCSFCTQKKHAFGQLGKYGVAERKWGKPIRILKLKLPGWNSLIAMREQLQKKGTQRHSGQRNVAHIEQQSQSNVIGRTCACQAGTR